MPPRPNEKRREQLLDELEAIIIVEGFSHLRVGAMATRLSCSRSTLYKLAPSKEELVRLIFERFTDRAIAEAKAEADKGGSTADRVMRFSDVIDRFQMSGSEQFWRDVREHPVVAEVLGQKRMRGARVIQGLLEDGIAKGEFRPVNTDFIARLVWLGSSMTRDVDLMAEMGMDRTEASHELMSVIVDGMRNRE